MASVVDIYNMALSHIRGGRVSATTDTTLQAQQCNLFYETCRNQVLEDVRWGFASRVESLALLDSDTFSVFNWAYVYQYPSNCLRINRLILNHEYVQSGTSTAVTSRFYDRNLPIPDHKTPVPYAQFDVDGTRVIAANDSNLRIDYNTNAAAVMNPVRFPSSFVMALSHLLASMIAVQIVGEERGSKMMRDQLALYRQYISTATANELNDQYEAPADSESITIRS